MSLDWQKVHIALAKGMQQAADERALEPPSLAVAKNARFTELGGVQKRYSYSALAGTVPSDINQVQAFGDQLIGFTDTKIYAYNSTDDEWVERCDYLAASTACEPVGAERYAQYNPDRASLGGVTVYSWQEGQAGDGYLMAVESATGSVLGKAKQSGLNKIQLLALSDRIIAVCWAGSSTAKYKMLLPSNIASSTQNEGISGSWTNLSTGVDMSSYCYGLARVGSTDQCVIAIRNSGGTGYETWKLTGGASGAPTQDYQTSISATVGYGVNIAAAPDGRCLVMRPPVSGALVGDILASAMTVDTSGVSLGSGTDPNNYSAVFESSASAGEYTAHYIEGRGSNGTQYNTIDTAGTAGSVSKIQNQGHPCSEAFAVNGDYYAWVVFSAVSSVTQDSSSASGFRAALQNTYYLLRLSDGLVVAKAQNLYGASAGAFDEDWGCPHVEVSGSTATCASLSRRRVALGAEGSDGFEEESLCSLAVEFNTNDARRGSRLGRTLYLSGGQVHQFDGLTASEVGFNVYPYNFGLDEITGSISGTYAYKATLRWTNAQGESERSTTAAYAEITLAASKASDLEFTEPSFSRKTATDAGSYPALEVWRTAANPTPDSPFYLATSLDPEDSTYASGNTYIALDGTWGSLGRALTATWKDNLADSSLIQRQVDPEQGQLEPIAPPAASIVHGSSDRLFIAGIDNDPNLVWYSRQRKADEVAHFSDLLTVSVPDDGGAITALATLNETLVVFCERAIYMLPGSGFNNDGSGQNYGPPRLISNDIGAQYAEAVATLPDGLIFRSEKGWHVLDRSWQVNYIGAPVEDYDSDTVVGVHVMPDAHEVRVTTTSRVLVWNTRANAWSEWEISGARSACVWNGKHVIVNNSGNTILQDDQDYSNVDYALDLETAWIKLDGLQGFSRARFLRVLGEYRSAHSLRLRVARNYRKSGGDWAWDDDKDWTATATEAGDALRVRHRLSKQKCEALKVRITDKYTPTGDGEPSVLESGSDATNQTSYTTSAFTPAASTVIYAAVATAAGASPNTPTLSGHGTWVEVGSVAFDSSRKVSLFRTKTSSAPSSSAVTIDFSGQTQFHGVWAILAPQNPILTGTNGADSIGNTDTDSAASPTSTLSTSLATLDDSTTSGHLAVVYHPPGDNATATGFTEVVNEAVLSPSMELTVLWATGTAAASITTNTGSPGSGVVSAEVKRSTAPSGESLKLTGLSLEYGVKPGLGQLPAANKQ